MSSKAASQLGKLSHQRQKERMGEEAYKELQRAKAKKPRKRRKLDKVV